LKAVQYRFCAARREFKHGAAILGPARRSHTVEVPSPV
jgi:hypothetical protein